MSRRESRNSMNVRQNDALFEFENFKRKFLLANKHITKLNSTLSVRIEELNAQISSLYTENLRLRASEIALAAQLKREREKSRKVISEAESAAHGLSKHLGFLRQTFSIQTESPPSSPTIPRATRRPPSNPNPSPSSPINRISRPPNVPGIYEDDEPFPSSSEEREPPKESPRRKSKSKPRLSGSRLPLPSRVSSPPPIQIDFTATTASTNTIKRKPNRRQSGLLVMTSRVSEDSLPVPRPSSPAFGSPVRREAGLAEEREEIAAVNGDVDVEIFDVDIEPRPDPESVVKREKKKKSSNGKDRDSGRDRDTDPEDLRSRDIQRKRQKEDEASGVVVVGGKKLKLKDVTNSPTSRTALLSIDNTVHDEEVAERAPPVATRPFLATTPPRTLHLPTPEPSSPGASVADTDASTPPASGRERRVRKSVNYAEPKLNTKMRKPDGTAASKKRASAAAVLITTSYTNPRDDLDPGHDADNDTEARSSLELPLLPLRGASGNQINPALFPLPPSRPVSSASNIAAASSPSARPSSSTSMTSSNALKRKKSRPYLMADDEEPEDDGAEADAEYVPSKGAATGWVNTEGRRRSANIQAQRRTAALFDEERRHSIAV